MKTIQLFQREGENQVKAKYTPNGHYVVLDSYVYEKVLEVEDDIFGILFLSGDIGQQSAVINTLADNY